MHEDVFRELHREILAHDTRGPDWNGHRTFAVDGSKINLPRPLAEAGYPLPGGGAHYPQGLLSCLYRLDSRMPADFTLTSRPATSSSSTADTSPSSCSAT